MARLLHENVCTSESLSRCSPKAQDAFPRFMLAADNFGTFQVNAAVLKGKLWPLRRDVRPQDILGWLAEYQQQGMVMLWEDQGKRYGLFTNWSAWQRIDPRLNRKHPEPPENLHELPGNSGNYPQSIAIAIPNTIAIAKGASPGFAVFWHAYPNKKAKRAAERAWHKLQPNEQLQAVILASLQRATTSAQWLKEDGQFIPHPATWLNGRRWEDDLLPGEVQDDKAATLRRLVKEGA